MSTVIEAPAAWLRDVAERGRAEDEPDWKDKLLCSAKGAPKAVEANVATILRLDPAFAGRLRWNELSHAAEATGLPWQPDPAWREWTDSDDVELAIWCQEHGLAAKPTTCAAAVQVVAGKNRHHPVRAYLDGLRWDGTPRLDDWLVTYLGVVDGNAAYVREVGRRWPIQAVARAYHPGCKADHALILEGAQGIGKSTVASVLAVDEAWFCDEVADLGGKDAAQDLKGKWLVELAELSAMKRSEVERTKAFMSRRVDHYRPSYGRRSLDHPRQCAFVGTTNSDSYLGDESGGRRFWPVKVGTIRLDALREAVDQLWAEAAHAFKAGERWWLDPATERLAAEAQATRQIEDPWTEVVLDTAERHVGDVTVGDALTALNVPMERRDQTAQNRVARILKAAGWEKVRQRVAGTRVYTYRKAECPPLSPLDDPPRGDKKGSNNAPVPTVPTVPTSFSNSVEKPLKAGAATHATGFGEKPRPSGDTRDTRTVAGFSGPTRPARSRDGGPTRDSASGDGGPAGNTRDPRDDDGWLAELKAARKSDERNGVIRDWTVAAGGRPGLNGEVLVAEVPRSFLDGPIAHLARRYGWDVRGMGR